MSAAPHNKRKKGAKPRFGVDVSPDVGKATQIKPGEVRNPGGRPKRRPITEAILELLIANDGKELKRFAKTGLKKAADGDFQFWKEIREALEGKSPLPLVGPEDGGLAVSEDVDERLAAITQRLRARVAERGGEGAVSRGAGSEGKS